jgi:type II secretory pathway pseudopilin PulG
MIVVAIISVIAAIAIPGLRRARMTGNETAAMASLKHVNAAEVAYAASCGYNTFAVSLAVLGTPPPGGTSGYLAPDLTSVETPQKNGYLFTLGPGLGATLGPMDCNGNVTQTAFYATATPVTFGTTGTKSYATNALNTVWQVSAAAAPIEPFGPPAIPVQ